MTDAAAANAAQLALVVASLSGDIRAGRLLTGRMLEARMGEVFGAPASTGAWDMRSAYDALETAAVHAMLTDEDAPSLDALIAAEKRRPTQTRRSEDQVRMQQFSTPLPYAFLAARAARIGAGDLVLEPSAGTGALAGFAKRLGAGLIVNEIDARRRALLGIVAGRAATRYDAAQIDDFLPREATPSVVLMNPPFSSSFDRAEDKTMAGRHLLSALKRLAPGGRLVAIMPERFVRDRQRDAAWASLAGIAAVRMALTMDGRVYRKQGTTIDTALIVVDKAGEGVAPGAEGCVFAAVETLAAAQALIDDPAILPDRAAVAAKVLAPAKPKPAPRKIIPAPARAAAPAKPARRARLAPIDYAALKTPRVNAPVSEVYASYRPQRVDINGAQPHPTPLVESIAMASVAPPPPSASALIPMKLIEDGSLSEAQIETVLYAAEAHGRMLPGRWSLDAETGETCAAREDDPQSVAYRAGFFLGDGTGCGKGRQVASVILDNWLSGRRRALWVSKNDALLEDAIRDWTDIGGAPTDIKPLSRWKAGEPVTAETGILFTTYATLRSMGKDGDTRLDQITAWLTADCPEGEPGDWGPVLAFDEAHAMGNAAGGADAGRGKKAPSQQGLAGLKLQTAIPAARVLYVSATGATTVENLAYATRLGLWGAGADYPFPNREGFLSAMHSGGVAAMEVVARDLKAMGLYLARSLSFEGVEYEIVEHALTDRQRMIYDSWAEAFQIIHANLAKALEATNITGEQGTNNSRHKSAILSRFEGLKQRFFGHMLTGMKTPAMIEAIRKDLEAGNSAVIQLVSTGEALLNRRLDALDEEERAELSLDLTPREYCLTYLMEAFPVQLHRVIEDENGNTTTELVRDPETGAPVVSREAEAMRDALIEKLGMLDAVPTALDQIVWAFGPEAVAEVTGRSQRPIWKGTGESRRLVIEKRGASANTAETASFMDGCGTWERPQGADAKARQEKNYKRVLVFSEAGGTGRSYHAALRAKNRERRIHYLLEPGWKADSAVQGLGRSHRAAQASAPLFRVMATDVRGEKRFISTIARRLDTLGALTKGQRQTGSQGLFRAEDSLESDIARACLREFYAMLLRGQTKSIRYDDFERLTGLNLTASDGAPREDMPPMAQFLNRLLALKIDAQNAIFAELEDLIARRTEAAREAGTLDIGVETLRADRLTIKERRVIYTDPRTQAETELVTMERADRIEKIHAARALALHGERYGLYLAAKSRRPVIAGKGGDLMLKDGTTEKRVRLVGPTSVKSVSFAHFQDMALDEVDEGDFSAVWDAAVAAAPEFRITAFHLVTGLLLPIWKHLPIGEQRIWRAVAEDGTALLGRALRDQDAAALKAILDPTEAQDAASILAAIRDEGRRVTLVQGAGLKLRRVGAETRIEIEAAPAALLPALKAAGCFTEIIAWKTRVFIPYDPATPEASLRTIDKVTAILPLGAQGEAVELAA